MNRWEARHHMARFEKGWAFHMHAARFIGRFRPSVASICRSVFCRRWTCPRWLDCIHRQAHRVVGDSCDLQCAPALPTLEFLIGTIMRVFTLITAAVTTAVFCTAASAAPAAPPPSATTVAAAPAVSAAASEPMMTVQMISRGANHMQAADAATLAGHYALSDGKQLRVSYERQRLYAALGDRRMELAQTGGTTFVGRGTTVSFAFDQVPFATDVTVTY
jgi:hypothetical protein